MDGNGRWARRRGLPRTAGHTAGEETLAEVVRLAAKRKVDYLTVFGFSTENWVRPKAEVRHILSLHRRVNWIGRPFDEPGSKTPAFVQRAIRQAIEDTRQNTGMVLTVAFDYGSRAELLRAAQHARTEQDPVTAESIRKHLYSPELPPVDLLIRTSGESRISNFLLWQIAGARLYLTERSWPDFDVIELDAAMALLER
jgi:undecaprenyl diphosphate synthase